MIRNAVRVMVAGALVLAFALPAAEVARALAEVRAFREVEREGRGAMVIGGKMADRATDRHNRVVLAAARAEGLLDAEAVAELESDVVT